MLTVEEELRKNGIFEEIPLTEEQKEQITSYVVTSLCNRFPELRLNFYALSNSINSLNMYVASMSEGSVGACYFYRNSSMYFRKGLKFEKMKRLAVHECIHHMQEIKNDKGVLTRMGLCSYLHGKAYGNALNEAAVQLMSSYANNEMPETENFYGITLPSDSPTYYPLLCNLMKQIGILTSFETLFNSTFYTNDAFFDIFKSSFGENNAFELQKDFEKILEKENKLNKLIAKKETEDLSAKKMQSLEKAIEKGKKGVQKQFLTTQNLIITSFFDAKIKKIQTEEDADNYRKTLYNMVNLIGKTADYNFFNEYYIKKMTELDNKYTKFAQTTSIAVVKKNKFTELLEAIKNLFKSKPKDVQDISDYYSK